MTKPPDSGMAESRRVFFAADGEGHQIFTISQNANDGSIYFSAPQFEEIDWLVPMVAEGREPYLLSYQSEGPGKLSLHGSGVTHVRPHYSSSPNSFSIRGNPLKPLNDSSLGMRHLFTIFLSKPNHRPTSPAMARKSDFVFTSKLFHPYVIIFWAIPAIHNLEITLKGSFHEDDLQEVPPNGGWGAFNLLLHSVVWFAYRTKHMEKWPRNPQACYLDGLTVPLLIGTGEGSFRLELRQPAISLHENHLAIEL